MPALFFHYLYNPRARDCYGDQMAIDPVCNMTVYEELAVSCEEYKGKHYCFCSKACREAFDKDPDLHANKPYELLQS